MYTLIQQGAIQLIKSDFMCEVVPIQLNIYINISCW